MKLREASTLAMHGKVSIKVTILSQGTKWIIGNGKQVETWKDNWLMDTQPIPTTCINEGTPPYLKFLDIMILGGKMG